MAFCRLSGAKQPEREEFYGFSNEQKHLTAQDENDSASVSIVRNGFSVFRELLQQCTNARNIG